MSEFFRNLKNIFSNIIRVTRFGYEVAGQLVSWYYVTAFLGGLAPFLTSYVIKLLIDVAGGGSVPFLNSFSMNSTTLIMVITGALIMVNWIEHTVYNGLNHHFFDYLLRNRLQIGLNQRMVAKISDLDIEHLENAEVQNLISKVEDSALWQIPDYLRIWSYIFNSFVNFLASFLVLFVFGWWLPMVITVVTLPRLYFKIKNGSFAWSMFGSGAPQIKKLGYLGSLLRKADSIQEIRIFRSRNALLRKLHHTQEYLYELNKKPIFQNMWGMLILPILEFGVALWCLMLFIPQVSSNSLSVGSFTFLAINTMSLLHSSISSMGRVSELYSRGLYVNEFFKLLSLPKLIVEPPNPTVFAEIKPPKIEFENVSFRYPNGREVLKNLSFTINPGETVAFVGVNGTGKTTIIKLLCRFYDVTSGRILINGTDIRDLSLQQWYAHLATLFQHFVHYNFTVRENILLGNPSLTDEQKMIQSAQMSGAADFIDRLPHQYDQMLGKGFEDGEQLSGGQWQKLAIARSFYEEAPVLIMDEPTSAIDAEAELQIFENLLAQYTGKTLILVSHRFSTVRNAQKIIVIDEGNIIESGTHTELMQKPNKYAAMFEAQAKGYR